MKKKVNIDEGLESLGRILLMMKYDNKKTLSENHNKLVEQSNQISSQEIQQQEKIWGEKIPNNLKTGTGIVEWQNKLSYDILRQLETMKQQKGWTGIGGSGLLRAEGSDIDIKCEKGKYTISGSLSQDINNKKTCVNSYTDDVNALYKPYNSKVNYTIPLLNSVMSIQEANYENLKGKILELLNKIPTSPTMSGKIRPEDIRKLTLLPQIILPFFGPVGLGISTALASYDAYSYYKQGDYTSMALSLIFAALDLGWLAVELKLTKLGKEESKIIIDAVKNNKVDQLSEKHQKLLKDIVDKSPEITNKIGANMTREVAGDLTKTKIVKDAIEASKLGKGYKVSLPASYVTAYGGAEMSSEILKSGSPKDVVEKTKCGYDTQSQKVIYCNWEATKKIFASKGTEEDNNKIKNAILKGGWIPYKQETVGGEIKPNLVPEDYQTEKYKSQMSGFFDLISTGAEGSFAEDLESTIETVKTITSSPVKDLSKEELDSLVID